MKEPPRGYDLPPHYRSYSPVKATDRKPLPPPTRGADHSLEMAWNEEEIEEWIRERT